MTDEHDEYDDEFDPVYEDEDEIEEEESEGPTPGPWQYIRDGDYWRISPTQIGGKDNGEGNEADYYMAAAAPELLAALEALMSIQDCTDDCWCEESKPETCEACVARAAISKARNQT